MIIKSKLHFQKFIIAALMILSFSLHAQVLSNEGCASCEGLGMNISSGNQPWVGNNDFLYRYLDKIGYDEEINKVFYRIPVKFWVYRRSDGSEGVGPGFIREQIRNLNFYNSINNTGIRFYQHPEVTYIDNDRLFILRYFTSGFFQTLGSKERGSINVLIVGNLIRKRAGNTPLEYHGLHNSLWGNIIIRQKIADQTLTHEIGHYFGLKHPHEHWKRGKRKQEAVDRSRVHPGLFKSGLICEYNGDKLCDTPAEPNMLKYSNKDCHYTGWNVTDNWGDVYVPDTDNIMSYALNRECRTNFTLGQIAVMLYTAEQNRYAKYWSTTNNENYYFDHHEPNDVKGAASEMTLNTPHLNTFHNVFNGRNKPDLKDDTDWFYFNIRSEKPQNLEVTISKNRFRFPESMSITIYRRDKLIHSENVESPDDIKIVLADVKNGQYFIRVSDNRPARDITGYTIKVSQEKT